MQGLFAALRLAGWHVTRHGKMICRERLSLRGTGQPVNWDRPPDIPDIWSRQYDGVSAVLQSNVDSVIAEVSSVGITCFQQQPRCYGLHRHKQPFMHVLCVWCCS